MLRRFWNWLQEVHAVLRPCRFAAFIAFIVAIAFQVPQFTDIFNGLAYADDSGFWSVDHAFVFISILALAMSGWYFTRALLFVEYCNTPQPIDEQEKQRFAWYRLVAPRAIGLTPIIGLALTYSYGKAFHIGFSLFYVAVAVALLWFFRFRRQRYLADHDFSQLEDRLPHKTFLILVGILMVSLLLLVVFLYSPVAAPTLFGSVALLCLASASWIGFGSLVLTHLTYRFRLPSLLVVMLALAVLFGLWNDNHQVRTIDPDSSDAAIAKRPDIDAYFQKWLAVRAQAIDAFNKQENRYPNTVEKVRYPVFIVAAEGGGIRAGYWAAQVLTSLEDRYPGFGCHVFAFSGVSGGSLGAAVFTALIAEQVADGYDCRKSNEREFKNRKLALLSKQILGEDFLSPVAAAILYPDLLQRFSPISNDWPVLKWLAFPDRAKYLEMSWERAWLKTIKNDRLSKPFLELWSDESRQTNVPSLFLNGTWVENGGRHVTSNLKLSEHFVANDDLLAMIDRKIRLSTAVHSSARFTYVSPAGTVDYSGSKLHIVDGGYYDNSGTLTAAEIYKTLDNSCSPKILCDQIRLVVIVISNSPRGKLVNAPTLAEGARTTSDSGQGHQVLMETLAPWLTLYRTRTARGYWAETKLSRSVAKPKPEDEDRQRKSACDDDVAPVETQLPLITYKLGDDSNVPLGWVLSQKTQKGVDDCTERAWGHDAVRVWLSRAKNNS